MTTELLKVPNYGTEEWWQLMAFRKSFFAKNKNKRASEHFRFTEFWTKDGTPIPVLAIPGIQAHCERFLEPMRDKFGAAHVLSGYRHAAYNRRIGGATDSQHNWDKHPTGVATDMMFARGTVKQWVAHAKKLRSVFGFGGIGEYNQSGFIHLDSRNYVATWGPGSGGN